MIFTYQDSMSCLLQCMNSLLQTGQVLVRNTYHPMEKEMSDKKGYIKIKGLPDIRIGQVILLAIGLLVAIVAFIVLQDFVTCWRLTSGLPGIAPEKCSAPPAGSAQSTPQPGSEGTPDVVNPLGTPGISAPALNLPPAWDGASRVTVLLIGLDYRDWEAGQGAPRSDTMILASIDPVSMTAGILAVPRDLWVNIPGFGYGKLNTAYSLGEGNQLPGGGPGLAMKTVENVIGIPIQYYAQVDFATFVSFIDAIGGVKVDVTEAIEIDPVGGGSDHIILQPGRITLPGELALAYARNRYATGDDFGRSARQMQIIMGIQERITNPRYWPELAANAYPLYQDLSAGIKTNLSFDDALRLGLLAREIPKENIKMGNFDWDMAWPETIYTPEATAILVAQPDKIRELRDQIFSASGTLSPMAQGDPLVLMQAEAPRVTVLNAAFVAGLAARTGDYLTSQGMTLVGTGDPTELPNSTILIAHSGKPYTLKFLMGLMNVAPNQIRMRFDPAAAEDIVIILGPDWGANNPLP
jgi:LCP family protein required for cell wall assembly